MSGIIIDTCIWSLALRGSKPRDRKVAAILTQLIEQNRATILGPIRQEVLSGYSEFEKFKELKKKLVHFPNEIILDVDYETAAEYSNLCRRNGVQGSHIDFLICAVAARTKMKIYTTDKEFSKYASYLPISIYEEN